MKGRVLIIDSDRAHSDALRDQLKSLGHEVVTESTSRLGLEVAETFLPSVIITDTSGDGRESFASLREIRARQPSTPIILAARGSSIETAVRASQDEGAYHYFEKPADPEQLGAV